MSEQQQPISGLWVVPNLGDNPVPGTLTLGESIELTVYGPSAAEPPTTHVQQHLYDPLPIVTNTPVGRGVTLLDGYLAEYQNNRAVFIFERVLLGARADVPDDLQTLGMYLHFDALTRWVGRRTIQSQPDEGGGYLTKYEEPELIKATVLGGQVSLGSQLLRSIRFSSFSFEHRETFWVEPSEPLSLEDLWSKFLRPLRYFVALATGQLPEVSTVEVVVKATSPNRIPVRVIGPRLPSALATTPSSIDYAFQFGEVDLTVLMPRWFEVVAQYDAVCDLLFNGDTPDAGYLTNRFFSVASAAEAAHRKLMPGLDEATAEDKARVKRVVAATKSGDDMHDGDVEWVQKALAYAHQPSFARRLDGLLAHVGVAAAQVVTGGDSTKWLEDVKETRNRIAHSRSTADLDSAKLARLFFSLDLLLRLILLSELGFGESELCSVADRDRRLW